MTPARPSDYVFSRPDADRMPDAVAGMSVPVLDADGRPAFSPRREDVLLLAEMARERAYLSRGLNHDTYEDERRRTVACDLSPHVRTRLPFDLLNDTVFHVDRGGRLWPSAGNDRVEYFGTGLGYDSQDGIVNPDADVFDGTFSYPMFGESGGYTLSTGFPDVARALQVPDYGSRCPSRAETAMGTSDSVRTLYWALSRMRRYAYTAPWEALAHDRLTWQVFSDYGPGSQVADRVIPTVLLSSSDGKTTVHVSRLSLRHDEDTGRYYHIVVTDAPYETDGYSYLYRTKRYSPYDSSVVATSFNENPGMLFGIRPHYVWYGSTYDASRTTWSGPSDVMFVFTYSYSWFGTGDDGSGPDAGAGSFPVLFPLKGGAAAPVRATDPLLSQRLQATCRIMANSAGGTNIATVIMPILMTICHDEAARRDPSFGQRPESESLMLASFTVLVDRTPLITPPDDWTWEPED